jgi:hypothetical protein
MSSGVSAQRLKHGLDCLFRRLLSRERRPLKRLLSERGPGVLQIAQCLAKPVFGT